MAASSTSLEREAPLAPLTWFRIGGPADILARPQTPDELSDLVHEAHGKGQPLHVLGNGSNILISDAGVRGTVVVLSAPPFKSLVRTGDETVQCGSGAKLARLVNSLADWGLTGGEGMTGIPGTVGGAIRTNAGTNIGEMGPIVRRVWALESDGSPVTISGPDCGFEYRSSHLGGKIILGAELLVSRGEPEEIRARMSELKSHRASTQPKGVHSAGCIFKNPPGHAAGKLLDDLGMKGMAIGEARISPTHANFIETGKKATALDVKALIDEMRHRVAKECGIKLELQLELWGFD